MSVDTTGGDDDPRRTPLPRDETGRYLHLKLKRFSSVEELSLKYAKTTWKTYPYNASVDIAPTSRSKCRSCRQTIHKGQLRYQLLLQCHHGCKNSAYFHSKCCYEYPETSKLTSIQELHGLQSLDEDHQHIVMTSFQQHECKNQNNVVHVKGTTPKENMDEEKETEKTATATATAKTKKKRGLTTGSDTDNRPNTTSSTDANEHKSQSNNSANANEKTRKKNLKKRKNV